MDIAEHLVDWNVVRSDPTNPREITEGLEDVPREEIPNAGADKRIGEKAFTTEATARAYASVRLRM